jgi:hypothetical protein
MPRMKRTTRTVSDWLKAEGVPRKCYSAKTFEIDKPMSISMAERAAGITDWWSQTRDVGSAIVRVDDNPLECLPAISVAFGVQVLEAAIEDGYDTTAHYRGGVLRAVQICTVPPLSVPQHREYRF